MAVLKSWEASIIVDGQKLPEYDDPDDDTNEAGYSSLDNKVTKYIEAVSESHFSIQSGFISKSPPRDIAFEHHYIVDGAVADRLIEEPKEPLPCFHTVRGVLKCIDGKWTLQKFRFAAIVHGL